MAEGALAEGPAEVHDLVVRLEHELYVAQSELAVAPTSSRLPHPIEERHVRRLESDIDRYSRELDPVRSFVLPRGSGAAAQLHVCRAVARRAERALWALHEESPQRPELLQWANRLSDLLFALALAVNRSQGIAELRPDYTI